ncbi:MAG: phage antirepressor KilAC domain-containing protein [Candidatus Neomarinimicrobiota bacterium]
MNEILKFENQNVDIIVENDEPLFEIYTTGMALGYINYGKNKNNPLPHKSRINTIIRNANIVGCVHGVNTYITEEELYDFMLEARTEKCKGFRKWVTNEVLPTIRKTGGYVGDEDMFVDTYLPYADENVKQLFKLNLMTIRQLNSKIEVMQPLADFAETVSNTNDLIDIGRMAKLLNDEHIPIGRNKLFEWLRSNKILMSNNTPYQQYVDARYFKVREKTKETAYGTKLFTTTYVTGKGQIYITEKLRKEYGIKVI